MGGGICGDYAHDISTILFWVLLPLMSKPKTKISIARKKLENKRRSTY